MSTATGSLTATELASATERITSTDGLTLPGALVRLARVIEHVYADAAEALGVTAQQARLLCLLFGGPVGMTDLSRLLNVERSSLTGLVDRVQQRGLVVRVRDDRDRRACRIALTDEGLRIALALHDDVTRVVGERLGEISADDDEKLLGAIKQLLAEDRATR